MITETFGFCPRLLSGSDWVLKQKNHIPDVCFLIKTPKKTWVNFLQHFFTQFRENCFCSFIHISTLLFIHTQMMMINLYTTPVIWTWSQSYALSSERRPSPHLLDIIGLLADSVWWTSHDLRTQRPSECLAAILCLLAEGWGKRCGGLCVVQCNVTFVGFLWEFIFPMGH